MLPRRGPCHPFGSMADNERNSMSRIGSIQPDTLRRKVEDAVRELESSRELEPSSSKVRFALGQAYRQAGRYEDAKREAESYERLTAVDQALKVQGGAR